MPLKCLKKYNLIAVEDFLGNMILSWTPFAGRMHPAGLPAFKTRI